jgi:TrmH family RNA methyltransferase
MIITSPHNPRLKELRRLRTKRGRTTTGKFIAEGEDLIAAAQSAKRDAVDGYRLAGTELGGRDFVDLDATALATVSTLGSGTRVIGVYEQRWMPAPEGPLCVYLHGVSDPGNVGTVLRSAQAFGASCVALGPACADPYSPKAVRASMGAIFGSSLARVNDVTELPGELVALVAGAGEPLHTLHADRARPHISPLEEEPAGGQAPAQERSLTLLIGAEREGLPRELVAACERVAYIPIASESLNAAMAATVALYELSRGASDAPASSRVRAS